MSFGCSDGPFGGTTSKLLKCTVSNVPSSTTHNDNGLRNGLISTLLFNLILVVS